MSPVDVSNKNFLSQDIKYHLEMGDSFYLLGGTLLDKKIYLLVYTSVTTTLF